VDGWLFYGLCLFCVMQQTATPARRNMKPHRPWLRSVENALLFVIVLGMSACSTATVKGDAKANNEHQKIGVRSVWKF